MKSGGGGGGSGALMILYVGTSWSGFSDKDKGYWTTHSSSMSLQFDEEH